MLVDISSGAHHGNFEKASHGGESQQSSTGKVIQHALPVRLDCGIKTHCLQFDF